jgi:hypothetical protein
MASPQWSECSSVDFVTPLVRWVSLPCAIGGVLLGILMVIVPTGPGSPIPLARILTGTGAIVIGLPSVASIAKGYRLTVARDCVVARRLIDRIMPYRSIVSVEMVEALARIGQMRTCLRFNLVGGMSYTFKNFNGSLKPQRESYQNVVRAKALIDRRLAELRRQDVVPPPPPPPVPAPVSRWARGERREA